MVCQPTHAARHKEKGNQSNIYLTEWARLKHQAELGDPDALFILGNYYYKPPKGSSFRQDLEQSAEYYFEASIRGHASAQYNMGVMFHQGLGVKQNDIEAYAWFKIASDNKSPVAKHTTQESARAVRIFESQMDKNMLASGADKVTFYKKVITEKRYRQAKIPK